MLLIFLQLIVLIEIYLHALLLLFLVLLKRITSLLKFLCNY